MKTGCYLREIGYERFENFIRMMGGKWKLRIIYILALQGHLRYGELKRSLSSITHKMLSVQLKELERDGLIVRTEYTELPLHVEYSLSDIGREPEAVVKEIYAWICKHENINKK